MGSPNGIANLLAWARAPAALVRWCEARAEAEVDIADLGTDRLTELVSDVPNAGWAPWIAATATIPMDLLAAAVTGCIESDASHLEDRAPILETLDIACRALVGDATATECIEAADRSERMAEAPSPLGYRTSSRTLPALARAAAHVARAAEAIAAASARAELERMQRARMIGAYLGGGLSAAVTLKEPPVVLARRALGGRPEEELVFAVDALGAALALVASTSRHDATVRAFVDALRPG